MDRPDLPLVTTIRCFSSKMAEGWHQRWLAKTEPLCDPRIPLCLFPSHRYHPATPLHHSSPQKDVCFFFHTLKGVKKPWWVGNIMGLMGWDGMGWDGFLQSPENSGHFLGRFSLLHLNFVRPLWGHYSSPRYKLYIIYVQYIIIYQYIPTNVCVHIYIYIWIYIYIHDIIVNRYISPCAIKVRV